MCEADAQRAAAAVQRTRQAGHSWLQTAPAVAVDLVPGSPVAGGMDGECRWTMVYAALPCLPCVSIEAGASSLGRRVLLTGVACSSVLPHSL